MNKNKGLSRLLLGALSLLASGILAGQAADNIAVIIKMKGNVTYQNPDESTWIEAKVGQALVSGGRLRTGEDGLAMVKFLRDGSMMRLKPQSNVMFLSEKDKEADKKGTVTKISLGTILFDVKRRSAEESFIVKTPTTVAAVKGTKFWVVVKSDSTTLVVCSEGLVDVMNIFSGNRRETQKDYTAISDLKDVILQKTKPGDLPEGENTGKLEFRFNDRNKNSKKLQIDFNRSK